MNTMTRDEWVRRYVSAMKAGGSAWTEQELVDKAEAGCDETERAYDTDPASWETPEIIAEEDLETERNYMPLWEDLSHSEGEDGRDRPENYGRR